MPLHRLNTLAHKLLAVLVGPGRVVAKSTPRRDILAALYVSGEGVELGALNNPLKVPRNARVRYVDCVTAEELRETYPDLDFTPPDIIDDAATLSTIPASSQHFVVACHILEHMEDPIGAIKNWFRVLKWGGVLFLAIPDKRFTFDCQRQVTTWPHFIRDHEEGSAWSRRGHYEEVARAVLGLTDERQVKELADAGEGLGHTHFHVWTQVEMLEFVAALRRYGLDFEVEAFSSHDNEGVFVLRKGERRDSEMARRSLEDARGQNGGH